MALPHAFAGRAEGSLARVSVEGVVARMDLPQLIVSAIGSQSYLVSLHAQRRLRERLIELWQIEAGVTGWIVEEVRPDDLPNPSIVCKQTLPDGAEVTVVWAFVADDSQALLVTVYFPD